MLRYVALIVLSAVIGSGVATILWVGWEGGTGAPNPAGFVMGFALFTMFFTVPGAMMLAGLQAILSERGIGVLWGNCFILIFAAFTGAAIVSLLSLRLAALGSVYAVATALMLLTLQRFIKAAARR